MIYEYHVVSMLSRFNLMLVLGIELVAQRQHPASFMFSRSNLLWFALFLRVCIISARLGLANGLDDPAMY